MWVESMLVVGDRVIDAAELDGWRLNVGASDDSKPHMLLAHIILTEDQSNCAAYSALTLLAVQGDTAARTGTIDLVRPLLTPSPAEQQTVRAWLIRPGRAPRSACAHSVA
jgi:hypothetical protein